MATRALVLGGGGPVGRAWESGLTAGLLTQGIDLGGADLIIGTSAGAIVGAELALGLDLGTIGPVVDSPAGPGPSQVTPAGMQQMMTVAARAAISPEPELEWQVAGQAALTAATCSEEESLSRVTFSPVSGMRWPGNFQATSIGTHTGRFQVWTEAEGIPIERAVAASSAFPGVWPPITIGQERYMDGGLRSSLNADLSAGYSRIVVVSCFSLEDPGTENATAASLSRSVRGEIQSLRTAGSAVEVITPSTAFLALTKNGTRMLDNSLVPDAYEAGHLQALDEGIRIQSAWVMEE